MRIIKTKIMVVALALTIMATLFTEIGVTISAADQIVNIAQINTVTEIKNAIQNKINTAAGGDTITVKGSKTDTDETLILDIQANKKIIWEAKYSGNPDNGTIQINAGSAGTFEIVSGGEIKNTTYGRTIDCYSSDTLIKVSGTAVVSTLNSSGNATINSSGSVEVTGGTVSTTAGKAIEVFAGTVTINGGTVSATTGNVIYAGHEDSNINITGGEVKATEKGGKAIINYGAVTVSGGTVSTTTGTAITHNGIKKTVTISGGTVKSTGADGVAISADGHVIVSGGTVSATTGKAIWGENVTLSGGKVTATTGIAIEAYCVDINGTATVSNGGGANPAVKVGEGWLNASNIVVGNLTVNGNVILDNGGISCNNGGKITINGNLICTAAASQIGSGNENGVLLINGNVTFTGTGNSIYAFKGSKTYIAGTVTSDPVIWIDDMPNDFDSPISTDKILPAPYDGYYWDEYTNPAATSPSSYVYIRKAAIPVAPTITTAILPGGTVGTAYNQTLEATGDSIIFWGIIDGNLPGGLSLSPQGVLAGTPSMAGTFTFTVKASNGVNPDATKEFTIVITAAGIVLKGDINGDGKVNGMDLLLMKQHILNVPGKAIESDTKAFKAADMNDDGKINGMDLLLLKKKILG